jgi:hypothetical protein
MEFRVYKIISSIDYWQAEQKNRAEAHLDQFARRLGSNSGCRLAATAAEP